MQTDATYTRAQLAAAGPCWPTKHPTNPAHLEPQCLLLCCWLQLKGDLGGAALTRIHNHQGRKRVRAVKDLQPAGCDAAVSHAQGFSGLFEYTPVWAHKTSVRRSRQSQGAIGNLCHRLPREEGGDGVACLRPTVTGRGRQSCSAACHRHGLLCCMHSPGVGERVAWTPSHCDRPNQWQWLRATSSARASSQ